MYRKTCFELWVKIYKSVILEVVIIFKPEPFPLCVTRATVVRLMDLRGAPQDVRVHHQKPIERWTKSWPIFCVLPTISEATAHPEDWKRDLSRSHQRLIYGGRCCWTELRESSAGHGEGGRQTSSSTSQPAMSSMFRFLIRFRIRLFGR